MGIEDQKHTSFICKVCKLKIDTIYMGRNKNVCCDCEKRDEPTKGDTLE